MAAELERYLDRLWASGREHDAELPDGAGTLLATRAA
jgi:hypothetical protein